MKSKNLCAAFVLVLMMVIPATSALAEWHFGLGTGLTALVVEGDIGINTNLAGPQKLPVDLDAEEVNDLMASAFGLGGYATNGTYTVRYVVGMLELEGTAGAGGVSADINYKTTGAEVTVGYPIYNNSPVSFSLLGGLRFTKQELSTKLSNGGTTLSTDNDNDWADVVVGAIADVKLSKDWTWSTRADAGFGGSEGTYMASTGVTWAFLENWSTSLSAKVIAAEYENGDPGDTDWYLYDVDEKHLSLGFLYHW